MIYIPNTLLMMTYYNSPHYEDDLTIDYSYTCCKSLQPPKQERDTTGTREVGLQASVVVQTLQRDPHTGLVSLFPVELELLQNPQYTEP